MEVILKKSVEGLGVPGDVLKGRRWLRAVTIFCRCSWRCMQQSGTVVTLNITKRVIDQQETRDREQAREIAAQFTGVTCTLKRRAGENDRLFGSVTSMDVAEALRAKGFALERRFLELAEPIRELGVFKGPSQVAYRCRCRTSRRCMNVKNNHAG